VRLRDKTAVVTGSSRGIGKAVALRFAREGADVVVNCVRNRDLAEAVAKEVRALGRKAVVVQASVAVATEARRLVEEAIAAFGRVDILVSNAGIVIDKPFLESTDEDWRAAMETNLQGFFNVARAVVPHMIERRYGRILATTSCIVEVPDFGSNHYPVCTAAKGGLAALLHPLAAELARHEITVNAVSPGYIATEMLDAIDPAGLEATLRLVPMRRYGKPEEIAAAMAFLASDEAAYITGQTLRVNGGLSMS
jgi:3-oxoacyl-[acyl-carrier protein] reductase